MLAGVRQVGSDNPCKDLAASIAMEAKLVTLDSIREVADEPVHELTLTAIVETLEKYPRKKPMFKQFLHDYQLLNLDELTEPLALELLEILDDQRYISTVRLKQKWEIEQKKKRLIASVDQFLEDNPDTFILLGKGIDCWLIAKKVKLNVYNINNNNHFQPYETNQDKEFFIVVIIKSAEEFTTNETISRFLTRGCKLIRVYSDLDVENKLRSI